GRRQPRHDAAHFPARSKAEDLLCNGLWRQRCHVFCAGRSAYGADDCREGSRSRPADLHVATPKPWCPDAVSQNRSESDVSLVLIERRIALTSTCADRDNFWRIEIHHHHRRTPTMEMTTEEAFVKVLQMHGIEHAFGIIGSAFMPISDLFPKAGITFWDVAHE